MYCSDCGEKAVGKFCWNCGAALHQAATSDARLPDHARQAANSADEIVSIAEVEAAPENEDWSQEVRYEALLRRIDVQRAIALHAAQAPTRISGEQFIELCQGAFKPLMGAIPLAKVATVAQSVYSSLGIGTGLSRTMVVPHPIGRTLVTILCT